MQAELANEDAGLLSPRQSDGQASVGLRRYGTSQTIASSFLGRHGLQHMGVSAESRGASVTATPRRGTNEDGDYLPPMQEDRAMREIATPRVDGLNGGQEAPDLVGVTGAGAQARLRMHRYSSETPSQPLSSGDRRADRYASSRVRERDPASGKSSGRGSSGSRWHLHTDVRPTDDDEDAQAPSPIVPSRALQPGNHDRAGANERDATGTDSTGMRKRVPPLPIRGGGLGSMGHSQGSDSYMLGSTGRMSVGSEGGDGDSIGGSRDGPRAALTRSMRPKHVTRQMSSNSASSGYWDQQSASAMMAQGR